MTGRWGLAALLAVASLALGDPSGARTCRTLVVTKAHVAYRHATTIEAAADEARSCDWILVTPGVYRPPVVVRTSDIHLRGLDRNRVVLDGGHRPGNGIDVVANGVWIENVTVRNFRSARTE